MDTQNQGPNQTSTEETIASRAQNIHKKPKKSKKKILLYFFLGLLFLTLLGGLTVAGVVYSIAKDAPELKIEKLGDTLSSNFFDIKKEKFYELGEKKRETVDVDEVPAILKEAIISIEDKRFEEHIGVDPIRIVGAALSNLKGNDRQGGSTLTQQLIKLSFFSTDVKDQNYKRKIQEAWLSIQLEKIKTKDEVLNFYINKVYMSTGFYGMETASKGYFGKELKDLSIAQVALLAGIPQAPADYDPILHPEAAKKRRDTVLSEMYKDKKITQSEYDLAFNEPIEKDLIKDQGLSKEAKIIDNYVREVIEEVKRKTSRDIYSEGLDIYTNLDLDAQKYIYNVLNTDEYIDYPDYEGVKEVAGKEGLQDENFQAAITVMDPNTGKITAQIGGRKVPDDVQLGGNLAVSAKRDFGSTVKPITDYAPAFEYLNYSTARIVSDTPYKYPGTEDQILNYDRQFRGNITLREALVDSRNVPAVKTLDEVGLKDAQKFLKGLGITYDEFYLSNAIKGDPSSLQMAAAYSPFANGGTYYEPYYVNKIVMPDGTEENYKPTGKRAMKESTAFMVTDVLKDVILRGTGMNAQIPNLIQAGKTGTSNYDDKSLEKVKFDTYAGVPDISFVGYTPNYVVSIWTGYEDYFYPIMLEDQQIASTLYKYIMSYLSQDLDSKDWEMPEDVIRIGSELYVKDHTTDQYTWIPSSSTWQSETYNSTKQSTATSSSQPPETSATKEEPVATSTPPTIAPPEPSATQEPEPPASTSEQPPEPPESIAPPESGE